MSKAKRGPKADKPQEYAQGALSKRRTIGIIAMYAWKRPWGHLPASPTNQDKEIASNSFQAQPSKPPAVDFLAMLHYEVPHLWERAYPRKLPEADDFQQSP